MSGKPARGLIVGAGGSAACRHCGMGGDQGWGLDAGRGGQEHGWGGVRLERG